MLSETLRKLYNRDLTKLRTEISQYKTEQNIWRVDKEIPNSAGNLCLHLVGNLNTFLGAILGNTGYVRHRDLEFSLKDIPQQELLKKIDETIAVVDKVLAGLSEKTLAETYPQVVMETATTTEFFLIHLLDHLGYHLGQINYHRRLLDTK